MKPVVISSPAETMSPAGGESWLGESVSPLLDVVYEHVRYIYYDMWNEQGDPRVAHYPLMDGGPWTTIAMVLMYLYFVKVVGPAMMANRKAYDLRGPILLYNIALIGLNGWFFFTGIWITNFGIDSWKCQPVDFKSHHYVDLYKINVGWLFMISKFIDFCDTIFFVLRKKDSQASPLHVFHHSCMPIFCWIGVKFAPGGNSGFFPFLNSFVHTIMYGYYALSTFPVLRPYLWWKKYITQLQMIQFVLVIAHSLYSMLIPGCQWPRMFMYMSIFNAFLFLLLFYSFFRKTYEDHRTKQQKLAKSSSESTTNTTSNKLIIDRTKSPIDCRKEQ